ncbi:MAG: hypothetical protein IPG88_24645 [Gemmatimonadetes bacterium]|nr:hypothetical protein [Gemmatimonadota bacterium]
MRLRYPLSGEWGVTYGGVRGGVGRRLAVGGDAASMRTGRWWTLRVQLLPDGRCGVALNGRVLWISPEPIALDRPFRLHLGDESAGTSLLHGPLEVWRGVRPTSSGHRHGNDAARAADDTPAGRRTCARPDLRRLTPPVSP